MTGSGRQAADTESMTRLIVRERDRADRNGHEFSLILFQIDVSPNASIGESVLNQAVGSRIRTIDEIGRFDGQLCALLPYTGSDGAWTVARDVAKDVEAHSVVVSCLVHTYPDEWFDDDAWRRHHKKTDGPGEARPIQTPAAGILSRREMMMDPTVRPTPLWKRTVDVLGALVGLVALSPLLLLIALLIRCVSSGPILFRQQRIGLGGRLFRIYKFRTMHTNVNTQRHHEYVGTLSRSDTTLAKLDHRSQLIPFGGLLRNLGLDELPQLWNVLRGDMSLVGPRPDVIGLEDYAQWNLRRFDVVPGITGLWQVNGKNRTTFNQMIRYDLTYTRKRSFLFDVWVFVKTLPAIVGQISTKKDAC